MKKFDDLCYKCRKEREGAIYFGWNSEHCHHEPREKPIQCWCERRGKVIVKVWDGKEYIALNFCPECGRPLT